LTTMRQGMRYGPGSSRLRTTAFSHAMQAGHPGVQHIFDMRVRRARHRAPTPQGEPSSCAGSCLRSLQEADRWSADHRWTNGQGEPHHQGRHRQALPRREARAAPDPFEAVRRACNHIRRLKTLRGLTPCEFIWQACAKQPNWFRLDPSHHIPEPYQLGLSRQSPWWSAVTLHRGIKRLLFVERRRRSIPLD
jgi:hypothetical protein